MMDIEAMPARPQLRLIEGGFDELYLKLFTQLIFGAGDEWRATADRLFVERALTAVPSTPAPRAED